jgi:hypothetical protein
LELSTIDDLCIPSTTKSSSLTSILKNIFDPHSKDFGIELVVENLDYETIWEEIQCSNRPTLKSIEKNIKSLKIKVDAEKYNEVNKNDETDNELDNNSNHDNDEIVKINLFLYFSIFYYSNLLLTKSGQRRSKQQKINNKQQSKQYQKAKTKKTIKKRW